MPSLEAESPMPENVMGIQQARKREELIRSQEREMVALDVSYPGAWM